MRNSTHRPHILAVGLLLSMACIGAAPASAACEPSAMIQAYVSERYEEAAKLNEHCIEGYRTTGSAPNSNKWSDEVLHYYYVATGSQIAAEAGRFQAAEDMLNRAKSYFSATAPFLVAWQEYINLTEGFYLEKTGRLYDAEQFYLQHRDQHTLARLAVLAMHRGDKTAAIDWAAQSLKHNPQNLTSRIVLASVSNTSSIRQLSDLAQQESQLQPAYYAEVWWATIWLREAGKIGPLPRIE